MWILLECRKTLSEKETELISVGSSLQDLAVQLGESTAQFDDQRKELKKHKEELQRYELSQNEALKQLLSKAHQLSDQANSEEEARQNYEQAVNATYALQSSLIWIYCCYPSTTGQGGEFWLYLSAFIDILLSVYQQSL